MTVTVSDPLTALRRHPSFPPEMISLRSDWLSISLQRESRGRSGTDNQ